MNRAMRFGGSPAGVAPDETGTRPDHRMARRMMSTRSVSMRNTHRPSLSLKD
jgi:hypothetical protein